MVLIEKSGEPAYFSPIVFCVFIIIEQSGTIDEVKKLYFKLSQTNEELQQANEKLQEYAVMKEKNGRNKGAQPVG